MLPFERNNTVVAIDNIFSFIRITDKTFVVRNISLNMIVIINVYERNVLCMVICMNMVVM